MELGLLVKGRAQAGDWDAVEAGAECGGHDLEQAPVAAVFAPVAARRFLIKWGRLATA